MVTTVFERPVVVGQAVAPAAVGAGPSPSESSDATETITVSDLGIESPPVNVETETIAPAEAVPQVALGVRVQLHKFQRVTGIVGMICLIAGLAVWRFKPHSDDRLALLILVCAMFLAILHHYSMEENRRSRRRAPSS